MNITVKNLLKIMENKNTNSNQLQIVCNLSNNAISEWRKGKANPSQKALEKIAEYFNVPLSYFYQEHQEFGNKSEIQEIYDSLPPNVQTLMLDDARKLKEKHCNQEITKNVKKL